jgi:hypothetical protein
VTVDVTTLKPGDELRRVYTSFDRGVAVGERPGKAPFVYQGAITYYDDSMSNSTTLHLVESPSGLGVAMSAGRLNAKYTTPPPVRPAEGETWKGATPHATQWVVTEVTPSDWVIYTSGSGKGAHLARPMDAFLARYSKVT